MTKIRLALLAGGTSKERQVSLNGAREVAKNLNPEKYEVIHYDPATDLVKLGADAKNIDVAFILLHGVNGEDGTIQGYLDLLNIPYQGAGVLGSALAMDKNLSKELYRMHNLKVAPWKMAKPTDSKNPKRLLDKLRLPLVVKPVKQGSSIGMSIVKTEDTLPAALEKAFGCDKQVMIEEYIHGREITVGVLGNDELIPLPLVEIIPDKRFAFFDYEAKYQPGATKEICPAKVSETIRNKAWFYGLTAHRALQLRGYSRTDMIFDGEDIYVLETNTIPGMTPTSLLPQAAAVYGLTFPALLDRLIELAMEDKN